MHGPPFLTGCLFILLLVITSPTLAQPQAAAIRPPVQEALSRAQLWELNGNFDNAIAILESTRRAFETNESESFRIDGELVADYSRMEAWPAAIAARERVLSTHFLALGRGSWVLELARDDLRSQRFDAAATAAREAIDDFDKAPSPLSQDYKRQAGELLIAARNRDATAPSPLPPAARPPPPANAAAGPVESESACRELMQHLDAQTLGELAVPLGLREVPQGKPRGNAIDVFGTGATVFPVQSQDATNPGRIDFVDGVGNPIATTHSPDEHWSDELIGAERRLITVGKRIAVLTVAENSSVYALSGFTRDHEEREWCEFKVDPQPVDTPVRYVQIDPLELLQRAAQESWPTLTLFQYVMRRPGLDAARIVLEASRRSVDPLELAPSRSDYDPAGTSVLVVAVAMNRLDVLELLLSQGVDANLGNHQEQSSNAVVRPTSPLAEALKWNDSAAAELLLRHGADPNYESVQNNSLARDAFVGHPAPLLELLLDYGADPNRVPIDVGSFVQRKPDARDMPLKIELLLRHGADPGHWANVLFNAIARRSGLAPARVLEMRESDHAPAESIQYVSVRTAWMDQLLSNPTRARDNGLEPLLREAIAARNSTVCSPRLPAEALALCLPGALSHALDALIEAESQTTEPGDEPAWRAWRARECALDTPVPVDSSGWRSYVLGSPERAQCVIRLSAARLATLSRATP